MNTTVLVPRMLQWLRRLLLLPMFAVVCPGAPAVQFSISLGGSYTAKAAATDDSGYTYVAGSNEAYMVSGSAGTGAFAAKLDSTGTVVWNVSFGGSGYSAANSMAVDVSGNVYLAGVTYS